VSVEQQQAFASWLRFGEKEEEEEEEKEKDAGPWMVNI
jgi:hypothetical protein